ncbi:precursor of major head subunit [Sinorhizobium phage phiN3]|uniref:Precursor of major head subunit n=1 Tax=Sinorhizobium phage phiN3 TaxID=1647405 RepID=A0A0F6YPA3_9CAUD|nr:major head protein [Sinorhizobium phage phiN3]AKF13329.1 precursor of major head subunit [Sinorhizobium phage phiN3]
MLTEEIKSKWAPVIEHDKYAPIKDAHRASVTAVVLENTENVLRSEGAMNMSGLLQEAAPTTNTGNIATYDPVLISLVRRSMPNLIAYDIAGVQPMTGPTGLIFAMRSKYVDPANSAVKTEAFYNEVNTAFTGTGAHVGSTGSVAGAANVANTSLFDTGRGMSTAAAEALGDSANNAFHEMTFDIEKVTVTAKSRALKAEYTSEIAQDLKAIHGLDAETELANMLAAELLTDINRELVRTIYATSKVGAAETTTPGVFDLDVDASGRWSVEKFKGLMFQIEREANAIARETRRGKGNILICSSDVASALQMAGILDHTPALNSNNALSPDDTGNTFIGVLNGRFRVYIDPYAGANYLIVGYKGSSTYDAGLFYAPYVPLQMVRAVGENSFQSKIGFKTRYGLVANPFAQGLTQGNGALVVNSNVYYRRVSVTNLL